MSVAKNKQNFFLARSCSPLVCGFWLSVISYARRFFFHSKNDSSMIYVSNMSADPELWLVGCADSNKTLFCVIYWCDQIYVVLKKWNLCIDWQTGIKLALSSFCWRTPTLKELIFTSKAHEILFFSSRDRL